MNKINDSNFSRINLSQQEIAEIHKASSLKKLIFRIKYGLRSLLKNPAKAFIALAYIIAITLCWVNSNQLIHKIYFVNSDLLMKIFQWIFVIGVPFFGVFIFLVLMSLFGTKLRWAKKAENAFISAGIYTRAKKAPFLLDRYKDKETPVFTIWEVYLNGNTKTEFQAKRENIESELGVIIHDFKPKNKQILLIYTTSDNVKIHKNNRIDMDF